MSPSAQVNRIISTVLYKMLKYVTFTRSYTNASLISLLHMRKYQYLYYHSNLYNQSFPYSLRILSLTLFFAFRCACCIWPLCLYIHLHIWLSICLLIKIPLSFLRWDESPDQLLHLHSPPQGPLLLLLDRFIHLIFLSHSPPPFFFTWPHYRSLSLPPGGLIFSIAHLLCVASW